LRRFFRITCAILNAFFPPLFTQTEEHDKIVEMMMKVNSTTNKVQKLVEKLGLNKKDKKKWLDVTDDDVLEFPVLSLDQLEQIACGGYQLKMGKLYNEEFMGQEQNYKFFYYKPKKGLIRVKMQSRFSKRQRYYVWIDFKEYGRDVESIKGYYCQCKSGARTIGCCSHTAAVSD
jgi:hypothetical protein